MIRSMWLPTLEVPMSVTNMIDTVDAISKETTRLLQHYVRTDEELEKDTYDKLNSLISTKHEMESILMEALKE